MLGAARSFKKSLIWSSVILLIKANYQALYCFHCWWETHMYSFKSSVWGIEQFLKQDTYYWSAGEIAPQDIPAFSMFLLSLLCTYIYFSGIYLHDFELKALGTLQNCVLLSCATLILLQMLYDRENSPNKSNNTKPVFPDHFPAINCLVCATVDAVKRKRREK